MRSLAVFLLLAGMLVSAGGCGAGQAQLVNDLKATGLTYHLYHDDHKQGPPGWDELIKYAEETSNSPQAIRRVKEAGYQIAWNAKFDDVKGPLADAAIAKPPGAGPTLWMDGSVR